MIKAKVCSKCKSDQPETNFSKDRSTRDGLHCACKDCNIAYKKAHREQISTRRKQYYVEHRETLIQQAKVWQNNNKDADRKTHAIWKKNHPEVRKIHKQARLAKKAGLSRTLTSTQWNHILNEFNNTCSYCGGGDKKLHQEHFIALSSGGEYTHNNIIPSCGRCNTSKGIKDFFVWYPTSKHYDKQRETKIMKFLHYTGASQQLTLCTDR